MTSDRGWLATSSPRSPCAAVLVPESLAYATIAGAARADAAENV
ncbi:MAG TPA: hypothetical protein VKB59_05580 [Micromonosporaceae bacterium]|nr:hypothetical protein [Micromonosporaceae bacterium]